MMTLGSLMGTWKVRIEDMYKNEDPVAQSILTGRIIDSSGLSERSIKIFFRDIIFNDL